MTTPDFVHNDLAALGFEMPAEVLDRLGIYLDLILEANQTTNLTAIRHREQAWSRLIVDSLTPLPGLPEDVEDLKLIDIGTGAGLPGIPLAIARPDVAVTLIEATGKKIAFLNSVIDKLGLTNTTALQDRAEKRRARLGPPREVRHRGQPCGWPDAGGAGVFTAVAEGWWPGAGDERPQGRGRARSQRRCTHETWRRRSRGRRGLPRIV